MSAASPSLNERRRPHETEPRRPRPDASIRVERPRSRPGGGVAPRVETGARPGAFAGRCTGGKILVEGRALCAAQRREVVRVDPMVWIVMGAAMVIAGIIMYIMSKHKP